MILPVIMAGGSGTRLWPLSRSNYPKQFLKLNSEFSMLQETCNRLANTDAGSAIVICNEEHRFIAAEQLREINAKQSGILLEPEGKNTAPAIALAAFKAIEQGQDPVLLVLAADHVIKDVDTFTRVVEQANQIAGQDKFVTFGIVPAYPETGYGYIKQGCQHQEGAFFIEQFVEKPDEETANVYLNSGQYLWNSGMFMFKASRYLEALERFSPDIYKACKLAMENQQPDLDFIRIDAEAFSTCPDDSIDYAIMEPLCTEQQQAVVVSLDAGWSDVGGFSALHDVLPHCEYGNALKGDVISINTTNSLIHSENRLIAAVGLDNLIIVDTKDAVLVADKSQSQQVKQIVNQLKKDERPEPTFHREVYRPWGKYDSVDSGKRFQVKRITVKPGAKLSVQMHHHRAEHWIVVSGTAKVTIDDQDQLVTENQSVYIPITAVHALENPGKVDLELIEVQSGSYLGEDDIVRFEDKYGRN